jgi:hypothetical protein
LPERIQMNDQSGCQDHKYCCKTCNDYTKKGSCMFITQLAESKCISKTPKSYYENGEGIYLNSVDLDLIGCIGCLSHSSIRGIPHFSRNIQHDTKLNFDRVKAPWSKDQVESINAYQSSKFIHPFTCGSEIVHKYPESILEADLYALHCKKCSYLQSWVYSFMADWSWKILEQKS